MPAPTFRYHAFISHRAADNSAEGRRWADWLRHSLESFEVPAEVAGRRTPAGPVPSRLFPVFEDDGAELTPAIREAIGQSRVLVVVCSPGAARSARVAEEVRLFKMTGRDRVIALIVAGEPDARSAEDECFPETLKYEVREDGAVDHEWRLHPLAADVRADGRDEGFTTAAAYGAALDADGDLAPAEVRARMADYAAKLDAARMRIIAGVLGVAPVELSKRDHAAQLTVVRRGRRRALLVAVLFALLAAAAGFFAWREYERRQLVADGRSRADELIGSIAHDLREKLEPAGQLPLLADANERVTSHLTLASRDRDEPKLFAALAASLADAVEIHSARADYASALSAAQSALQIHERIAKVAGASPENTLNRVATLRRIAGVLTRMNQPLPALAQADAARKLGGDLVREMPGFAPGAIETAWAHYDAGDIHAALGKPGEARTAFTAGREIAARLAAKEPGEPAFQRALAEGHARLGELSQQAAALPEAMGEFHDAEKIVAALAAAAPEDMMMQASLAFVRKRMGLALALQRDFPAAVAQQRQVVEICSRLAKHESWNTARHFDHADALRRLGETLLQADAANRTEAITLFQQALDVLAANFKGDADARASRLRTEVEGLMKSASR